MGQVVLEPSSIQHKWILVQKEWIMAQFQQFQIIQYEEFNKSPAFESIGSIFAEIPTFFQFNL